jgi:hypothetical protein
MHWQGIEPRSAAANICEKSNESAGVPYTTSAFYTSSYLDLARCGGVGRFSGVDTLYTYSHKSESLSSNQIKSNFLTSR